MEIFPLPYLRDFKKKSKHSTTSVVFQSGKKQVQRNAVKPLKTWSFQCSGLKEHQEILEAFHDAHGGNTVPFQIYNDNDELVTVRFADPELQCDLVKEIDVTSPTGSKVVGFTANINVESVI